MCQTCTARHRRCAALLGTTALVARDISSRDELLAANFVARSLRTKGEETFSTFYTIYSLPANGFASRPFTIEFKRRDVFARRARRKFIIDDNDKDWSYGFVTNRSWWRMLRSSSLRPRRWRAWRDPCSRISLCLRRGRREVSRNVSRSCKSPPNRESEICIVSFLCLLNMDRTPPRITVSQLSRVDKFVQSYLISNDRSGGYYFAKCWWISDRKYKWKEQF